jgi:2-haloacid dehalogenase
VNVTLDVFSALIDTRTGGNGVFDEIAGRQRWALGGQALYRAWDREHKRLQRECARWEPFAALGRRALAQVLDEHRLHGDIDAAMTELWASLGDWPLWPDVARGLSHLARAHRLGLLSNIDDALLARTRLASLPFVSDLVITSERVRQYMPTPGLYHAAHTIAGPTFVHVAASARDVRGALQAGVDTIRLIRPGHDIDPAEPRPTRQVTGLGELTDYLAKGLPPAE